MTIFPTMPTIDDWHGRSNYPTETRPVDTEDNSASGMGPPSPSQFEITPDASGTLQLALSSESVVFDRILRGARTKIDAHEGGAKPEALRLISDLTRVLSAFDTVGLPALTVTTDAESGSIWMEWLLGDRRLGFVADANPHDSSWFFVRERGRSSFSDDLADADLTRLFSAFLRDEDL